MLTLLLTKDELEVQTFRINVEGYHF
jgi:NAD(P)-dependent dehydrogenase (short-subunit alcohol dehydrogenase family)